jgi:hypothetical protein
MDLVSSTRIGGAGFYPVGDVFYVGCKYYELSSAWIDDQGAGIVYSVEVGASTALGKRKNWLLLIDAGPITNFFATSEVLPNITRSIVGRLF